MTRDLTQPRTSAGIAVGRSPGRRAKRGFETFIRITVRRFGHRL